MVDRWLAWLLFATLFVLPGVTTPATVRALRESGAWCWWALAVVVGAAVAWLLGWLYVRLWRASTPRTGCIGRAGRIGRGGLLRLAGSAAVVSFIALGPLLEGGRDAVPMGVAMGIVGAGLVVLAARVGWSARIAGRGGLDHRPVESDI